jgi:hypothetical protein
MKTVSTSERLAELPPICGEEQAVAEAMSADGPLRLPESDIDFGNLRSGFTNALHMHQPLIPAGGEDLRTARVIGNLQHMMEHPDGKDNHNAPVFHRCYERMGDLLPELVGRGKHPRVMLDYSGCLLYGLQQMGSSELFAKLRTITAEPEYRRCVEWLGSAWGHPVAPSTPVQDYRLHVRAWQQHFLSIFGAEALSRVRGFSPAEMALPNEPDVAYEFVRTLKECGYRWVLVQEHTVERVEDGSHVRHPHLPHRLVVRNSRGESLSIVAVLKTQGSDTKLVAQMQPYYEARGLSRTHLAGRELPPLVAQIADGENGGVMMNEFPPKFLEVMSESTGSPTQAVNVSEYLEHLYGLGFSEADFPAVQPVMQKRLWDRLPDAAGPEAMAKAIEALRKEDGRFHMEGGSWTSNISWVRGYDHVLGPMESGSSLFAQKVLEAGVPPTEPRYRKALFYLLTSQTSCFRYWGHGTWTDYGRELCRRLLETLEREF